MRVASVSFTYATRPSITLRASRASERYVRPAVDAHSLNIPFPLLLSLLRRFRSVHGIGAKDFIILHTDTVNYFEAHAPIRGRANELRRIIPNAPEFPQHLVLCPTNNWTKSRICFIMKHAPFQFSAPDIRRAADADRALAGGHGHAPAGRPALPDRSCRRHRPARDRHRRRNQHQPQDCTPLERTFCRARITQPVGDRSWPWP